MSQPPEPDQPPSPYEPPPGGQPPYEPPGGQPSYGQPSYEHPGHPPHGQQWGQQPPYAPQVPYGQYGPPYPPGYGGQSPGHGGGYPPGQRGGINVLAILSLVFAFVFAPAGIALGHLARRQLRTSGEEGEQLATWGLILSYVFTGLYLLVCCGWLALVIWAGSDAGTMT